MQSDKIVVFTGAGISAESGLMTFRDSDGLWQDYSIEDVATPQAWERHPERVLEFYNHRRSEVARAEPNDAHRALVQLESHYEVVVITQNIDDLHERAGSSHVIHVHGEITKARSSRNLDRVYPIGYEPISMGDHCELGSQLRPHVVWFGESIDNYEVSANHIASAGKIMVVGTSLSVFPAAGLLMVADPRAEKIIIAPEVDDIPEGFHMVSATAVETVPEIVDGWLGSPPQ